jgi:hypothetical protein
MKAIKPTPTINKLAFKEVTEVKDAKIIGIRYTDMEDEVASILALLIDDKVVVLNTTTTVIKDKRFLDAIKKLLQ